MNSNKEYLLKVKEILEELVNSTDIVDIHNTLAELKQEIADEIGPVLDSDLCFKYRGYNCELCSCNSIVCKDQMLFLTEENFQQRFPHGVFSDKYVCFIYGHKDMLGHTKEECDDPDDWCPEQYLVSEAWLFGAGLDLEPGKPVNRYILAKIDAFLESHPEIK